MPVTLLPNFRTLSEFGQYHGDCGELATLAALHGIDPANWPLTLAFLNAMVADELRQGLADASLSGGQNIPSIDTYLARRAVAHRTVGYDAFNLDAFHSDLRANAGVHPVIVEWANAQALPGDESGVHFHYSTCGGIDTGPAGDGAGGAYLWADGDNRASTKSDGGSDPIRYTWPQIVPAQPIGYIIVTQEVAHMAWTREPDGGAHDGAGHHAGAGIAALLFTRGWQNEDGLTGEEPCGPDVWFLALPGGHVIRAQRHADGTWEIRDDQASYVVADLWAQLQAAKQPPVDPIKDKALATWQSVKAFLGEL